MLSEWLERALDFESYLAKADMNVPTMRENFNETRISPEHHEYFEWLCRKLPEHAVTVLAISEPWCGDCVENLPIVAKIASLYPCFRLAIFPRDQNLDIMDRFLTNGKRTIPVFVFYDERGVEIGRFIERPPGAHAFMARVSEEVAGLPEDERKRAIYRARAQLRQMYKEGLRDETIAAIRDILEKHYGPKDS